MDKSFRVSFNSPQSGWMSLSLNTADESLVTAVACAPYDSLQDLMVGLRALLSGAKTLRVKWNCEPDEMDFHVTLSAGDRVTFKVLHYRDHQRLARTKRIVFSMQSSRLELCVPFWRALRDLHRNMATDEFDRNWRRPFPESEMRQLTESLRSFKRGAKAQPVNRAV